MGGFVNSADLTNSDPINARMDSFGSCRSTWKDSAPDEIEETVDLPPSMQGKMSSYSGVDNLEQSHAVPRNFNSEGPKHLSDLHSLKVDRSSSVSGDKGSYHFPHRQKRDDSNGVYAEPALDEQGFQFKGRFKVTVPDSSPKDTPNGCTIPYSGESVNSGVGTLASIVPSLRYILHQNSMQKEETMRLIQAVDQVTGNHMELTEAVTNNKHLKLQMSLASAREKVLESHAISIQQRIDKLVEELQIQKMKNAKLEGKLSALVDKK